MSGYDPDAEVRKRVDQYMSQRLKEVGRGGVVTLEELQAVRAAEQEIQAHRNDRISTPSAAPTPEIAQLERQIANRRREADLTAQGIQQGGLLEVKERDETGRQIRSYYGDPAAWMDAFKAPIKQLVSFRTKFD